IDVRVTQVRILSAKADQPAGGRARALFADVGDQRNVLVKPDRIGELAGLRDAGTLIRGQAVGRVQSHIRRNVVKDLVVAYTESGADHRAILAEQRSGEARSVGNPKHGSHVVLIGFHAAV